MGSQGESDSLKALIPEMKRANNDSDPRACFRRQRPRSKAKRGAPEIIRAPATLWVNYRPSERNVCKNRMYNLESRSLRRRTLDFKTLSNAPINEALIAMRLNPTAHSSLSVLEETLHTLPDDYQTPRVPITLSQTQLNFCSAPQ